MVFSLSGDNIEGLGGFNGAFYHHCWDVVDDEIWNMVKAFFCGFELPRFITHTNVMLISKQEKVARLEELRPISLCSFVNKVFQDLSWIGFQ